MTSSIKELTAGDVFSIKTPKGLAFLQLTHEHEEMGYLIRVLDAIEETVPNDERLANLVGLPHRFVTFFPLDAALDMGIVERVGHFDVPPSARAFPRFKVGAKEPGENEIRDWEIWDGRRTRRKRHLTAEEQKLPVSGIVNDTLLTKRIVDDWRPEDYR
jgi:hypothetical protein